MIDNQFDAWWEDFKLRYRAMFAVLGSSWSVTVFGHIYVFGCGREAMLRQVCENAWLKGAVSQTPTRAEGAE